MNNQDTRYNNQIITNNQFSITKRGRGRLFGYWLLNIGICLVIVSWLLVILMSGCARTVTQLVTYGDQMVVEVTLKGTLDADLNRYFLVLSSDSNYNVPRPGAELDEDAPEFIEPGMNPQVGSPESYYTKFYSTWAGYIVLDRGDYYLVKGPFELNQTPTREPLSALGEISAKINFSFRLGRIFENIEDIDKIYFDFITVSWSDETGKIPKDHLPSKNNYISSISGSIVMVDDEEESRLDPSLDILDCKIEIQ